MTGPVGAVAGEGIGRAQWITYSPETTRRKLPYKLVSGQTMSKLVMSRIHFQAPAARAAT